MKILRDGQWVTTTIKDGKPPMPKRGLGDWVHVVAQPIARGIDFVAGTKLTGCRACARRREWLNKLTTGR